MGLLWTPTFLLCTTAMWLVSGALPTVGLVLFAAVSVGGLVLVLHQKYRACYLEVGAHKITYKAPLSKGEIVCLCSDIRNIRHVHFPDYTGYWEVSTDEMTFRIPESIREAWAELEELRMEVVSTANTLDGTYYAGMVSQNRFAAALATVGFFLGVIIMFMFVPEKEKAIIVIPILFSPFVIGVVVGKFNQRVVISGGTISFYNWMGKLVEMKKIEERGSFAKMISGLHRQDLTYDVIEKTFHATENVNCLPSPSDKQY